MQQKLDILIAKVLFRKRPSMNPPYHILTSAAMVWWARPCGGVAIVDVKTQHNSAFTYRSYYDRIGKSVGYRTILEMIIVIGSNRRIWADFPGA